MKFRLAFFCLLSLLVLASPSLAQRASTRASGASNLRIAARLEKGIPFIVFLEPELRSGEAIWEMTLLRSTNDLGKIRNSSRYPIAGIHQAPYQRSFTDYQAPEGVRLYYQLKTVTSEGRTLFSNVASVSSPLPRVSKLRDPFLLVDKLEYVMLLVDGEQIVRSFPIALGQNSLNRKLHFDRASTPEGVYRVSGVQPQATYHKALDLNYPNTTDQVRYDFFRAAGLMRRPAPHIGGEIQVHGDGIYKNWTWGCVALRNKDMDWLLSRPEIRVGLPVYIAGSEISPEDLLFMRNLSRSDKTYYKQRLEDLGYVAGPHKEDLIWALSQFQMDRNLTVTGVLDLATADKLAKGR